MDSDKTLTVDVDWKITDYSSTFPNQTATCTVLFSEPFSHLNTEKKYPLPSPSPHRCAVFSIKLAAEILLNNLELKGFLQSSGEKTSAIINCSHAEAVSSVTASYDPQWPLITAEESLLRKTQKLIKSMPGNVTLKKTKK